MPSGTHTPSAYARTMAALLAVVCLLGSGSANAGTVRLRASAVFEPEAPITLASIAHLEGEDALAHGSVVIAASASAFVGERSWADVTTEDVRGALRNAGVRLSGLALGGRACTIRLDRALNEPEPEADAPKAESQDEPIVVPIDGPATVRVQAARALAGLLGVEPERLRLRFAPGDAAFLDERRDRRRIIVQPTSTGGSHRLSLAVRVMEADRIVDSRTIRVDAEVRRRVVIVQSPVKRKDAIDAASLAEAEMWIELGGGEPVESIEAAAGSLARTRLEAGTILRRGHLESAVIVRRNELVTVYAVRGGIEVKSRARARADAREGDVIEFRAEGSKQSFTARVTGAGVAVLDMDLGARPEVQIEAGSDREGAQQP